MLRYLLVDFKVMMRSPIAVFFSLAFPLLMMVVIMVSYGNIDIGGGLHLIDKYLLVALGIGVLPLTLISFPIWIANRIEDGSLKRLTFLGVRASYMIASDIIVHIAMGILTFLLCFICALLFFGLHIPSMAAFFSFLLHYLMILITYLLIGAVLALCFPSQQVLMPLGLTIMFSLFLFCGVFGPFADLPETVQLIGSYIPMKYGMNDLFNVWQGSVRFDADTFRICMAHIGVSLLFLFGLWRFRRHKL